MKMRLVVALMLAGCGHELAETGAETEPEVLAPVHVTKDDAGFVESETVMNPFVILRTRSKATATSLAVELHCADGEQLLDGACKCPESWELKMGERGTSSSWVCGFSNVGSDGGTVTVTAIGACIKSSALSDGGSP